MKNQFPPSFQMPILNLDSVGSVGSELLRQMLSADITFLSPSFSIPPRPNDRPFSEVLTLKHESRILGQWSNSTLYLVQRRAKPDLHGQTAQSLTCSIMEKPHTGLDECPRILLSCFKARNSGSPLRLGNPSCHFTPADPFVRRDARPPRRHCQLFSFSLSS